MMKKFPSKEYELIQRLQNKLPPVKQRTPPPYETMIGDDAAIRACTAGERLIMTADISVENVHFSLDTMGMDEIGYRAMAGNLSDCAAMGAAPDGAIVQLVFPKNRTDINVNKSIEEIYAGFARACERWNFPIVGGDLSGGGAWTIGITLIGSIPPCSRPVKRTGVMDGDALWVTGTPGQSAAGLAALRKWGRGNVPNQYQPLVSAHIAPSPKIDEGILFASCKDIRAMMDLSDGLSKDIATLCYDNDFGFTFDTELQPSAEMQKLSEELKCDWRDWYYHGGEEYELLISCEPSHNPPGCIRLGQFTSKHNEIIFIDDDGTVKKLLAKSWDHCR